MSFPPESPTGRSILSDTEDLGTLPTTPDELRARTATIPVDRPDLRSSLFQFL